MLNLADKGAPLLTEPLAVYGTESIQASRLERG